MTAGLQSMAALAVVLALVVVAGKALRRLPGTGRTITGRLSINSALRLDAKRRLLLVGCEGREILVLTGGGTDQIILWEPRS